ncbi:hypothetical protein BST61_g8531 [Cercospora zeina]
MANIAQRKKRKSIADCCRDEVQAKWIQHFLHATWARHYVLPTARPQARVLRRDSRNAAFGICLRSCRLLCHSLPILRCSERHF